MQPRNVCDSKFARVEDLQEPVTQTDELELQVHHIRGLFFRLKELLQIESSRAWEREYECRDLVEEVWRLQEQLGNSIPHADFVNLPRRPRTGLEVAHERTIENMRRNTDDLRQIIFDLEKKCAELQSKNWELGYSCRDLANQVWRLEMKLRSSVSVGDMEHSPWKPRTALERELEDRIAELEAKIRNPEGSRSRSRTM